MEEQPIVEEPKPTEPTVVEEPKPSEPTVVEEPKKDEEPKVEEEPKKEEPKPTEEPKPNDDGNHLNDLIASLREEISALKEANTVLVEKVNDLGKMPSANPINVNGKNGTPSTYSSWRDMMANMI